MRDLSLLSDPLLSRQGSRKKIAIATTDFMGPVRNGGVGTAYTAFAELLAAQGHEVVVLFCEAFCDDDKNFDFWQSYYRDKGIRLETLRNPSETYECLYPARRSLALYEQLKHRHFDLIHFPDFHGIGYYSLLAKKLGIAFQSTTLCVVFNGPQDWIHLNNDTLPATLEEVAMSFMERRSVEWADVVVFPSDFARRWAKKAGWKLPERHFVEHYPRPGASLKRRRTVKGPVDGLIFFGRLENRKGIDLFIEACKALPEKVRRRVTITFLGRYGVIDGKPAKDILMRESKHWNFRFKFITELNQKQALEYLRQGRSIAVIPSRSETLGNTVLECLNANIPFLASRIAPFKEMVPEIHWSAVLFKNKPNDIARAILAALESPLPEIQTQKFSQTDKRWAEWHSRVTPEKKRKPGEKQKATLTVVITHRNRPRCLKAAIQSLEEQTHRGFDVLIADDASRCFSKESERNAFARQFSIPISWVRSQKRQGPGALRNLATRAAKGDFILFMDDDNLAKTHEVETFLNAQAATDADILSCCFDRFNAQGPMRTKWVPLGPCLGLSAFFNVLGDTNSLFRKSILLKTEGFEESGRVGFEDFDLIFRAVLAGARHHVIPEALFWYREHDGSFRKRTNESKTLHFRLRNFSELGGFDLSSLVKVANAWKFRYGIEEISNTAPLAAPERTDLYSWEERGLHGSASAISLLGTLKAGIGTQTLRRKNTLELAARRKEVSVMLDLGTTGISNESLLRLKIATVTAGTLTFAYRSRLFGKVVSKRQLVPGKFWVRLKLHDASDSKVHIKIETSQTSTKVALMHAELVSSDGFA